MLSKGGLVVPTNIPFATTLPIATEHTSNFWLDYSTTHLNEHLNMINSINSLLQVYNIPIAYQSIITEPINPQDKVATQEFATQNRKEHDFMYTLLNQIGLQTTPPQIIFPMMSPGYTLDVALDSFLFLEKSIHLNVFQFLNNVLGL